MDLVLPHHLDDLLAERQGPCVSIYLPTHRVWSETPQDPIRLRNLLHEAESRLSDRGIHAGQVQDLLEPVRDLLQTETFWRTQSDGLALFLSKDTFLSYRLPLDFEEMVVVHDSFYIKPLLRLFAGDGRFYVLALDLGHVRILAGTHYNISQLDLEDTPTSLAEALQYDEFLTEQQSHSGGAPARRSGQRATMFHGQGAADDANIKKRIVEFFRQLDNGVCDALEQEQAPLVLAGIDHLRGLYRDVNHYNHLADEDVAVNPTDLSLTELHHRAWALVEPRFREVRQEAVDAYEQLAGTDSERTSDKLEQTVPAASFQRVKVLFVRDDNHAWGTFDKESKDLELHEEPQPGDEDLLDVAVAHTVRNGGTVYVEDANSIPGGTDAAAIFRF